MYLRVDRKKVFAYSGPGAPDAKRPYIVFVHGAGMDHSVWGLQSRYFRHHGYNVLALDLPGHGQTEGGFETIEEAGSWLRSVFDALGLSKAVVVGHSMGALIALEFVGANPDRASALALLGVGVPMRVSDGLLNAAKNDLPLASDMIVTWGHAGIAQIGGNPSPGMWMTGGGARLLLRSRPGVLYSALKACKGYQRGLERAQAVSVPALLLLGAQDRMTPSRSGAGLSASFPNARVQILPDSGHMIMAEAPNSTLDALIGLAGGVESASEQGSMIELKRVNPPAIEEPTAERSGSGDIFLSTVFVLMFVFVAWASYMTVADLRLVSADSGQTTHELKQTNDRLAESGRPKPAPGSLPESGTLGPASPLVEVNSAESSRPAAPDMPAVRKGPWPEKTRPSAGPGEGDRDLFGPAPTGSEVRSSLAAEVDATSGFSGGYQGAAEDPAWPSYDPWESSPQSAPSTSALPTGKQIDGRIAAFGAIRQPAPTRNDRFRPRYPSPHGYYWLQPSNPYPRSYRQ